MNLPQIIYGMTLVLMLMRAVSGEGLIIQFTTTQGTRGVVEVASNATIGDLRAAVFAESKVGDLRAEIWFANKQLSDTQQPLADAGVGAEATVELRILSVIPVTVRRVQGGHLRRMFNSTIRAGTASEFMRALKSEIDKRVGGYYVYSICPMGSGSLVDNPLQKCFNSWSIDISPAEIKEIYGLTGTSIAEFAFEIPMNAA